MILNSRFAPACLLALLCALAPSAPSLSAADEHGPLHEAMEDMGRAFTQLSRGLRQPDPTKKTQYLEMLQTLQAKAVEAKVHTPASIEKLPEAERPKQLIAYRTDLAAAIETMLQLERAILADDWTKAQSIVSTLRSQRVDAHKKYNPEEEEGKDNGKK